MPMLPNPAAKYLALALVGLSDLDMPIHICFEKNEVRSPAASQVDFQVGYGLLITAAAQPLAVATV